MQDQETNKQSLRFGHWTSLQVNARIEHTRQLWPFDKKTPNLTMVLCDGEKVRDAASFCLFVQSVGSCEKSSNNSDALKNVDPIFDDEPSYPIEDNYTARSARREPAKNLEYLLSHAPMSVAESAQCAHPSRNSRRT
jgi:hypothetical protein